jgi:PIN domain nuclease of toxin-antitoxin system
LILLDTHTLIWAASDPKKLGTKSLKLFETEILQGAVSVSVTSWLELDLLIERRNVLSRAILQRVKTFSIESGIVNLSVDAQVAQLAGDFVRAHGDHFDLMIAATACVHRATLITADTILLSWKHALLRCQDATA